MNIEIFKNEEFGEIRTMMIDGDPWFVGKDVAEILGYANQNRDIVRHVDEEDRRMIDKETQYQNGIEIGQRGGWIINESGVYSLILSSRLGSAKKFKRWVTSEVLPSIRKHGLYATPETVEKMVEDPDFMIAVFQRLKEEHAARIEAERIVEEQREEIAVMKPKSIYHDMVWNSPGNMTTSQIAKDYGWTAQRLNRYLARKKIQYRRGNVWYPYKNYQNEGFMQTATTPEERALGVVSVSNTRWTPKGRIFIYNLLKLDGVLPICEQPKQIEVC